MKLAFVLPPIEPYSARGLALSTIVHHTTAELERLGHRCVVITVPDPSGLYGEPQVRVLPSRRSRLIKLARSRAASASEWDWPDQGLWIRSVTRLLSKEDDLEGVVVMNDVALHSELKRQLPDLKRATWLENELRTNRRDPAAVYSAVQHFFCCSGYIRDHLFRELAGSHDPSISVVTNCLDVDAFVPSSIEPRPEGSVLFVGRLDPNKGPDIAVEAVAAAQKRGSIASLTIAGPRVSYSAAGSEYEAWLTKLHGGLAAIGGTYLGTVARADLPTLYQRHSVVMVSSRSNEPFGMVALEAMGAGCAVVASDRGGLVEATGGLATYVDVDSPEQVGQALTDVLSREAGGPSPQVQLSVEWARGRDWSIAAAGIVEGMRTLTQSR